MDHFSYRQAQATVLEAIPRLKKEKMATKRPEDYYAQMAKSDEHMKKVRSTSVHCNDLIFFSRFENISSIENPRLKIVRNSVNYVNNVYTARKFNRKFFRNVKRIKAIS